MRSFILFVFISLIAVIPAYASPPSQIKIGSILPLSGDLTSLGNKLRDGILLAAEDLNAGVIFEDGALSKPQALSAFQKLTSSDGVRFIVGPFGPDQTLVLAPAAEKTGTLLIAVAMCESRFINFRNVFCIFPKSEQQIAPLIAMLDNPDIQKVAYFGEELQGFEDYRNRIRKSVKIRGKKLVLDETFHGSDLNFRTVLTRLRSTGVDVLAIGGANMAAVVSGFRQARELGLSPKVRWYLSEHDKNFFNQNRDVLNGAYGLAIPPTSAEFSRRFRQRFGYEPDLYSSLAYDGTTSLIRALNNNPDSSISAVESSLTSQVITNTATPGFKFDSQRMVSSAVALTRIQNGSIEFVK